MGDAVRLLRGHHQSASRRARWIGGALAAAAMLSGCGLTSHAALVDSPSQTRARGSHGAGTAAACLAVLHGDLPEHGGAVSLPVAAGPIITRQQAVDAARAAAHAPATAAAAAKLSSWAEVLAMLRASSTGRGLPSLRAAARGRPWTPVWAVLVAGPAARRELAVVQASTGRLGLLTLGGRDLAWFRSLTDRDPRLGGCPGGSTVRLPFGVLTRQEEEHLVRAGGPGRAVTAASPGASVSFQIMLTTVPALNHADPSLYGGCFQQHCSVDQLIWPTIEIVRAKPGATVSCLPGFASYPPGYRPKQVKEYAVIGVPGNDEISCRGLPRWVAGLKDLAPPAGR